MQLTVEANVRDVMKQMLNNFHDLVVLAMPTLMHLDNIANRCKVV